MKRVKILVASVLFCAMGYVGYTTHEKMTMSEAEKFMQANVEALTQDEGGTSGWLHCRCHFFVSSITHIPHCTEQN